MVTASAAARGGGARGDGQRRRGESLGCRSRREEKGSFGEEKQKPSIYLSSSDSEEKPTYTKGIRGGAEEAAKKKENSILAKSGGTNPSHRMGRSNGGDNFR
jgi:hypothetical protein